MHRASSRTSLGPLAFWCLAALAIAAWVLVVVSTGSRPVHAQTAGRGPVVLIHGWHAIGDDRLEGSSFEEVGRWLQADGVPTYWAPGLGADAAQTTGAAANVLGRFLLSVAERHPRQPIALLAHSYGGLIAREYLESPRYGADRYRGVAITKLVTLGAPMAGVDLWTPLLLVLGDPFNEPSVWELMPEYMATYNRTHQQPADVAYTAVAGDARAQSALLWLLPPSDGAISVASAHALGPTRGRQFAELVTQDIHTYNAATQLLGFHSYLDFAPTYRQTIRPALGYGARLAAAANRDGEPESDSVSPPTDREWADAEHVPPTDPEGAETGAASPRAFVRTRGTPFVHGSVRQKMLAPGVHLAVPLSADGAAAVWVAGGDGLAAAIRPLGSVEAERWLPAGPAGCRASVADSVSEPARLDGPLGRLLPGLTGPGFDAEAAAGTPAGNTEEVCPDPDRAEPVAFAGVGLPGVASGMLAALGTGGAELVLDNRSSRPIKAAWLPVYPPGSAHLDLELMAFSGRDLVLTVRRVPSAVTQAVTSERDDVPPAIPSRRDSAQSAMPSPRDRVLPDFQPAATLFQAHGSIPLDLRDDGTRGDAVAGDGTFSTRIWRPDGPGFVRATARLDAGWVETEAAWGP